MSNRSDIGWWLIIGCGVATAGCDDSGPIVLTKPVMTAHFRIEVLDAAFSIDGTQVVIPRRVARSGVRDWDPIVQH